MSLPELQHEGYTIQDWESWEGRFELIHGVAFDMTPSPSPLHQELVTQVWSSLTAALGKGRGKGGWNCKVFVAPLDLYLPREESVYQPDLMVVCDPSIITGRGIEGIPALVVEILSPATLKRDLWIKRGAYEAAGIPEYLIVDPDGRRAELLRLEADGRYLPMGKVPFGARIALLGGRIPLVLE